MKIENVGTLDHDEIEEALRRYVREKTGKLCGTVHLGEVQYPRLGLRQEFRATVVLTEVPVPEPQ